MTNNLNKRKFFFSEIKFKRSNTAELWKEIFYGM